jgi:signal transduction histidine kinase
VRENKNKAQLTQAKNELSEAIKNLQASDKEREIFVREMQSSLKKPIRVILEATAITLEQRLGKLDIKNYGIYFSAIQDAAKQIELFTTEFLHSSRVNIHDVLNKCVIIQRRYAEEASITLVNETLNGHVPDIWLDRLRIQQVVLSILHHIIFLTPDHKKPTRIIIRAVVEMRDNEPSNMVITIKDNGQGVDEAYFKELWEKKYGEIFDVTKQNLSVVQHLIELHHGTLKIEAVEGYGTCFTLTLPYLDKSDLETHPSELRNTPSPLLNNNVVSKDSTNIISFPKKKN